MNPSDPGLPASEQITIETSVAAPAAPEATPSSEPALVTEQPIIQPPEEPKPMEAIEATPEDEKKIETPEVTTPPENPAAALREQLISLVPDEAKSQAAALIRSLLEFAPGAPAPEQAPAAADAEGAVVRKRYEHLPFRPRITREETATSSEAYGSLAGDPEPE